MKKLTFTLLILLSLNLAAQTKTKITLKGNPKDSVLIKKKQSLESKGFDVVISDNSDENPLVTNGDQEFRKRHLDKLLPTFKLKDIKGQVIDSEQLKGKFVHINFWSVTCKPCIEEFPELDKLKEKYQSKDFIFISFAPESIDKVQNILAKHPLTYVVIPNAKQYYDELGIDGYPKNFFIDKQGIIREVTDGTIYLKDRNTGKQGPDNYRFYDQIMGKMK